MAKSFRGVVYKAIIAASDTPAKLKRLATHFCDGTNDEVEIQAAVTQMADGKGLFLPGNFNFQFALATTLLSSTSVGATTIQTPISIPVNSFIAIDTIPSGGSVAGSAVIVEYRTVLSVSGTGPYTLTLNKPLKLAHSSGVPVVVSAVTVYSNTEIEIMRGAILHLRKTSGNYSFFGNANINGTGDLNIHIAGDGILDGHAELTVTTANCDQFAVNFEQVYNGRVDVHILNPRTLEARLCQCKDVLVKNKYFENMGRDEEVLWDMTTTQAAHYSGSWSGGNSWQIDTPAWAGGRSLLKVTLVKGSGILSLFNNYWSDSIASGGLGGIVRDLRFRDFSMEICFDGAHTDEEIRKMNSLIAFKLNWKTGYHTLNADYIDPALHSNSPVRVFLQPTQYSGQLNYVMSHCIGSLLQFDARNWDASVSGTTVTFWIGPIKAHPIPREMRQVVIPSFDDGDKTDGKIQAELSKYNARAIFFISPAKLGGFCDGQTYEGDIVPSLKQALAMGAEIGSHGYYHNCSKETLVDEIVKSIRTLERDFGVRIRHMAIPGGLSAWTGNMVAKCHQFFQSVRTYVLPQTATFGETVPVPGFVPITDHDNGQGATVFTLQKAKDYITGLLRNHQIPMTYCHRLYPDVSLGDVTIQRLDDIFGWLYDLGVSGLPPSEAYPKGLYATDPLQTSMEKSYLQGKKMKIYRTKACAAASTTYVHAAISLTTSAQKITTGITNPDVYRCVSITGGQAGQTGNVLIEGTNWAGEYQADSIALSGTTTVKGKRPFKTVTMITVPAQTNAGDTVAVGICDKLGIPDTIELNTDVIYQARKTSAATSFTIESVGTCDFKDTTNGITNGTVDVGTITANDAFEFHYYGFGS